LEAGPFLEKITPVVNVCYDGYDERFGYGAGVHAGLETDWGLLRRLSAMVECYPVAGRKEGVTGPKDSFAGGVELETYGHHFAFLAGNSSDIGTRRLMLGTHTSKLYFGFNIRRLL
jgi:hypothetical protein